MTCFFRILLTRCFFRSLDIFGKYFKLSQWPMKKIIYLWSHVHIFVNFTIKTFTPPDKYWKNRSHACAGLLHLQLSSYLNILFSCRFILKNKTWTLLFSPKNCLAIRVVMVWKRSWLLTWWLETRPRSHICRKSFAKYFENRTTNCFIAKVDWLEDKKF